jgi:adenosine deaminase CECR1
MSQQYQQTWRAIIGDEEFESTAAYDKAREALQAAERNITFDAEAISASSDVEKQASEVLRQIKLYDQDNTYGPQFDEQGSDIGMRHAGQHFLGNVDLIDKSWMMEVAKRMPKGAHLHVHFNSCLPASFLIQQARDIDAMYIRSTVPLTSQANMDLSRISFMVLTPHEATHIKNIHGAEEYVPLGNVFDNECITNNWMPYKQFQNEFEVVHPEPKERNLSKTPLAELWLEKKMQISEEEAHGAHQTGRG